MTKIKLVLVLTCSITILLSVAQTTVQKYDNVDFSKVSITNGFWKPHVDKISAVTIPMCIQQTEVETPRIQNFEVAAGLKKGIFKGIFYDDSDVYKALEAIAYSLKNNPNSKLEAKADEWISKIEKSQQPDGYINTFYVLNPKEKRWTDMNRHEAYCGGHLIEAGIAYFEATGKRALLDVGIRFADHLDSLFGPGKRHWVPGHEEIELALVKLYKNTGNKKYFDLAEWFINERGHGHGTWGERERIYYQDDKPLTDQTIITGHAVRAMYLYTAAADVAALNGNEDYMNAMKTVWKAVVHRNCYITGGIGSSHRNEGFTEDYDLPNSSAYCETCASVGMVLWNQRMGELTGDSKYIDVLERSLYNGALDGISLNGELFFYDNVLASDGSKTRRRWFGTACCPSNIARLIASLGDYVYGKSENTLWVNLFIENDASVALKKGNINLTLKTNYPWDGKINLEIDPEKDKADFTLKVRIPGWACGEAIPGNLYTFRNTSITPYNLTVNKKSTTYSEDNGYIVVQRTWKKGDKVEIDFPMEVKQVEADRRVKANVNRIAYQRGPLVYCVEGEDNQNDVWNILISPDAKTSITSDQLLTEKMVSIWIDGKRVVPNATGTGTEIIPASLKAIPYYLWNNRSNSQMQVWLPTQIDNVKINSKESDH